MDDEISNINGAQMPEPLILFEGDPGAIGRARN